MNAVRDEKGRAEGGTRKQHRYLLLEGANPITFTDSLGSRSVTAHYNRSIAVGTLKVQRGPTYFPTRSVSEASRELPRSCRGDHTYFSFHNPCAIHPLPSP